MQAVVKVLKEIMNGFPPALAWFNDVMEAILVQETQKNHDLIKYLRDSTLTLALEYKAEQHESRNQEEVAAYYQELVDMAEGVTLGAAPYTVGETQNLPDVTEFTFSSFQAASSAGVTSQAGPFTPSSRGLAASAAGHPITPPPNSIRQRLIDLIGEIKQQYAADGVPIPSAEILKEIAKDRYRQRYSHQRAGITQAQSSTPTPPTTKILTRAAAATVAKRMGWPIPTNLAEARDLACLSPHFYLDRKPGQPVRVRQVNPGLLLLSCFGKQFVRKYCRVTAMTCQRMWNTTGFGVNLDGASIVGDTFRAVLARLRLFLNLESTDRVAFDAAKVRDKLEGLMFKHPVIGNDMNSFCKDPMGRDMTADELADEADARLKFASARQQQREGQQTSTARDLKPREVRTFLAEVAPNTRDAILREARDMMDERGNQRRHGGGQVNHRAEPSAAAASTPASNQQQPPSPSGHQRRPDSWQDLNVAHGAARADKRDERP
jgi:hypothetical protein